MAIAPPRKEDVLASFERKFIDSAWRVSFFYNTTGERLTPILGNTSDEQRFRKARDLMRTLLGEYKEALGKTAVEHFEELLRILVANPEWIDGDAITWTRAKVDNLLNLEPAGVLSDVDCWFRWFCDGPPKFVGSDRGKSGWREPWTAPDWADDWEKNPTGDHLSDRRTASLLKSELFLFAGRIEFLLDQAVDAAHSRSPKPDDTFPGSHGTAVEPKAPSESVPSAVKRVPKLSEFEEFTGPLWKAALAKHSRIPEGVLLSLLEKIDQQGKWKPDHHIAGRPARKALISYNRAAEKRDVITTFESAYRKGVLHVPGMKRIDLVRSIRIALSSACTRWKKVRPAS